MKSLFVKIVFFSLLRLYNAIVCFPTEQPDDSPFQLPDEEYSIYDNNHLKEENSLLSDQFYMGNIYNPDINTNDVSQSPRLHAPPGGGEPIGGIPAGDGIVTIILMIAGYILYINKKKRWFIKK